MNNLPLKLIPACLHLRHKMMYVDDRQMRPGLVDNQSETRVFWCNQTMDPLGPDRSRVGPEQCSQSRSCYCAAGSSSKSTSAV